MKSVEEYKNDIAERYIQDFKTEIGFFNRLMILPITNKMKDILKSDKKVDVNDLQDLEDLWFWRKVLGAKIFDKQLFGNLVDKILNFLKEKQEKIIKAKTEWRLDELLNLVVSWKLDILEERIVNPDDGKKDNPDDGKKDNPDDGKKDNPDDGKKDNPDDGKKDNPDNGKKDNPDDGKKKGIDNLKGKYKLSHEDFVEYFEGERFYQRNIGNCWLLAAIDSLVSFWDYEKLVRSSVSKDKKGFTIRLPLWSKKDNKKSKEYFVSFSELKKSQSGIYWNNLIPVDWKSWIKALVRAFLRHTSNDGNNGSDIDFLNLKGGRWVSAFNSLVSFPWMKTYCCARTISEKEKREDKSWTKDVQFVNTFRSVLESFNPQNDMLTLTVRQEQETNNDRKNQPKDNYDNLWHYSRPNHEISVEAVKKSGWNLIITVSNPWDSERAYDISFDDLLKSCSDFWLCTKKARTWLQESTGSYWDWSRRNAASDHLNSMDGAQNVNQIVEITWEKNEELRKARGDIIVENLGANKIVVTSYNYTTQVERSNDKIIIWTGNKALLIPEAEISDIFNKEKNEAYRLHLYWAKIANMIHFIQNKYSKGDNLYLNSDWTLQYDRVWPRNTDIIKDWGRKQIWISRDKTKREFVKHLEKLWYKCEIKL